MYAYVQYFFSKTVKHLRLNHKLHVKQIWDYLCIACISCKMRVNSPSLLIYAAQIQTLSCDKCYYKNVLFLQKMQKFFFTKFGISQYLQLLCALVFACISIRCLTIIYTNMQWLIACVTEKNATFIWEWILCTCWGKLILKPADAIANFRQSVIS